MSQAVTWVKRMSKEETMIWKDSKEAFEKAIRQGRLSSDGERANYAGNYMYMGTPEEEDMRNHVCGPSLCRHARDLFKNILTRKYDV